MRKSRLPSHFPSTIRKSYDLRQNILDSSTQKTEKRSSPFWYDDSTETGSFHFLKGERLHVADTSTGYDMVYQQNKIFNLKLAAVSEGWLDLRVRNETDTTFQISLTFDSTEIVGQIFTNRKQGKTWRVVNRDLTYTRKPAGIFEDVDVMQQVMEVTTGRLTEESTAYKNRCEIGCPLPADTPMIKRGN